MKKTIQYIVAFVAALVCGGAWAGVDETGVQPCYWWTFDGGNLNGDNRAVATKNWSGGGDRYLFSEAGKSVKGGDPYIDNNDLNNAAWTAATSFSLVGSFKVDMQTRGDGTTDETKALLYGIGWNADCFILAADRTKAYVMWNSSRVRFTNSADKSSLETENLVEKLGLGTNDLTTDFHSYALVYDRPNTTLYVYVDGVEVLKKTGVTINLKADGWTRNYGNAGILSMPGGSEGSLIGAYRTKTECDDYRIYTAALKPYQLKRLAFNEVATWTSFAAVKGSAITLNSDQGSTYTLTVPAGCSVSKDGALVLGANGGLNVSSSGGFGYYTTMELDVANCQANKVLAHVRLGNDAVIVKPENDGKLHQRWSGNQTDYGSCDFENTKRQTVTIAFSGISSTAEIRGTQTFVDGMPAIGHNIELSSTTTPIAFLGIGYQYNNVGVATDMKVYGIRVYARRMSTGTVASSYKAHECAVNATVSAGFDGGTAASTIVGGTAPTGVSEWNANNAAYVNVRGSTTNKAMPTSKSQSGVTHAPHAGKPAAMTADNDWTVNFVARLPAFAPTINRDRYAMWGLGPVTYSANNTGIGLVYTAENQVALEKWVKGGTNIKLIGPVTLTEAAKTYHAYTVTYNASAAGGEANPYYTLYIDGVKVGSSSVSDKPSISGNWCVGDYYGGAAQVSADPCNGMLVDDFAIWADTCMTYGAVRDLAAKFPVWPKHLSATVTADTKWSEIYWSEDVIGHILDLTVSNNAKISFDTTIKCASLTINGDVQIAADEKVFTDGCYIKPLIETEFGIIMASGTVTLDQTMKTGFVGALSKSDTAIELRAQNKEVISINLAGGKGDAETSEEANLVTDANTYYGLAPVPGDKWNNISGRWQTENKTVTLNSATAYDGTTTSQRDTMRLSATAKNTWNADTISNPFLRGYLDDGGGVTVTVTGIPYTTYDVIVYVTSDDARYALAPITVNGTKYTYVDGEVAVDTGTTDWGVGLQATPVFGKNAMIIRNQSRQDLTIYSTRNSDAGRGTLCAVQVINMGGEILTRRTYDSTIETSTTEATLEQLTYTGSAGSTLVSGELTQVTLNVSGTASDAELVLTINPATKTEFLKIVGARPVKIVASGDLTNASLIDLSETSGNVTLAQSAKKVTVGANARLVLADGVTVDTLTNNGGTIRCESDLSAGTVMNFGSGTYEYKNAKITGHNNADYTIHVCNGDILHLEGNNDRTSPNLVIDDEATVTIGSAVATYWYATGNTTYTQTGGTVTVPANGTVTSGTGSGLLLGYDGNGITSMTVSGGNLTVASSSLNFYNCPTMTVSGTGHVKAKGVFKSSSSSTVTVSETGIFEIGSLGWSGVALTLNGGKLKAYENSTMSSAITISSATTIEVPEGVTLTISGAMTGSGSITKTGAGVLDVKTSRPTLDVRAGSVTLTATDAEIASGAIVVTVSSGAAAVSVEQVTVLDGAGHELNVASVAKTSDTQLTITLQKFEPITGEKLISELHLPDDAAGTLEIRGGATEDAAFTVTFDAALPAGVTVSVSGHVKFVTGGDITSVPLSSFGYADGTVVEIVADFDAIEIPAGLTLCIDANAATTTDPLTVDGKLTGSGAVAIKNGAVKFTNNENGYTGGLTVKSGAIAMTSQKNGFGATGSDPGITVENGGAVDLANTVNNMGYHYVIAGRGVNNSGALYSTQAMGTASRQTSQIKLSGDAMIVCDYEWGLVGDGYGATVLNLARHTLTKQGSADFILINAGMGGATSGAINVAAGGIHTANNSYTDALGNYNLTMAEGTTLNLESNMTINSLVGQGEGVKVIGNRTLTANLYTGKVVVESGSPTMTGADQCARASFVVKSDATMNVGRSDFFSYNQGNYGTVDVYGTLNFVVNRETLREDWTFNFYSGCTVNGFGDSNEYWPCAMQFWSGVSHTLHFPKSKADQTGVVNFNATLGLQNNVTFDVAKGVKVVCGQSTSGANTRNLINRAGDGKKITKEGAGTLKIDTAYTTDTVLAAGTLQVATAERMPTVTTTNANMKVGHTVVNSVYTYTLVDPETPIQPTEGGETIVVPEVPAGGIAIEPGANVQVPPETTVIVVKYGDTVLNPVEGPKYVSVKVNESTGKVELETTDAAKPAPTAIAMSMPTDTTGEKPVDQVAFTITNPIPGLFYAVSSCDTPDGTFESATGDQATSTDAKTVSIPMTFTGDNKVKYYKVSVKATK